MMQKAFAAMDLTSPGSPPFHLIAHVHYTVAKDSHDGIYEMLWAAPDRWREGFKMEGVDSEIALGLGDKLYVLRSGSAPSLPLLRTRAVVLPSGKDAFTWKQHVAKVTASPADGQGDICVDSNEHLLAEHTCFDPSTSEITLIRDSVQDHDFVKMQRSEFISIGEKRYPKHIASHYFDEDMDIRIDIATLATELAERAFTPPPGAAASDWCATPLEKGATNPGLGLVVLLESPPALIAYYLSVRRDGKVARSFPLRPASPKIDNQLNAWFRIVKFPVKSCGGNPIDYGEFFYLPNNLR